MPRKKWVHSVFFYTILLIGVAAIAVMAVSE